MNVLPALLRKEFKQIFRNKSILPLIFAAPLMQLLILPLAADYEVKNIKIAIVDQDRSDLSGELISELLSSGYFQMEYMESNYSQALTKLEQDRVDLILEVPNGLEQDLQRTGSRNVFVAINAINGVKANLGGAYLGQILAGFNQSLATRVQLLPEGGQVQVRSSFWYNPTLNYTYFMVPGILVILVTMVGSFLCSLNIVREIEVGTIEQINVSPIRKDQFILGKLIPFWIIGMFVFSMGLFIVARGVYGIVPVGSLALLYTYLGCYLLAVLGLGLLISTYSSSQQQAMSLSFFFMMIFLMMSGLFTPVESMPTWSRYISRSNPVTYFIEVIRMIVLKGSGLRDVFPHLLTTLGFALLLNTWAVLNYRKRR